MKRQIKWVCLFALSFALCGCRAVEKVVEVPVPIHDSIKEVQVEHDSVYVDRWHEVKVKGDTVYDTRTEYIYRERVVHDTVAETKEVPVTTTITETREVERELTAWQKFKMRGFWWLAVGLAGYILWRTRRLWGKFIKL